MKMDRTDEVMDYTQCPDCIKKGIAIKEVEEILDKAGIKYFLYYTSPDAHMEGTLFSLKQLPYESLGMVAAAKALVERSYHIRISMIENRMVNDKHPLQSQSKTKN